MPAFLISAPTLFSLLVQDSGLECCCTLAQYFFLLTRSLPTYLPSKFSALKLRVKIDRIIIISRKQINTRFAPSVQLGRGVLYSRLRVVLNGCNVLPVTVSTAAQFI